MAGLGRNKQHEPSLIFVFGQFGPALEYEWFIYLKAKCSFKQLYVLVTSEQTA